MFTQIVGSLLSGPYAEMLSIVTQQLVSLLSGPYAGILHVILPCHKMKTTKYIEAIVILTVQQI